MAVSISPVCSVNQSYAVQILLRMYPHILINSRQGAEMPRETFRLREIVALPKRGRHPLTLINLWKCHDVRPTLAITWPQGALGEQT
jgi:hypothetical protein